MARFFFVSEDGSSVFLAYRLKQDGHEVSYYVVDEKVRKSGIGDGLFPIAPHPEPKRGSTVIFDSPGLSRMGEQFRQRGCYVIGGNPLDADLELDRERGIQLMRAVSIKVPRTEVMASILQARAFVTSHPGVWYFKPNGKTTALTNHGEGKSFARWLEWVAQYVKGERFLIQAAVDGVEISTEGFFDGQRFVPPFNSTIEEKHFLAGDLGQRTGCETNVVWRWTSDRAPLPQETVGRLEGMLRAARYVGPIDLNAIIDPRGRVWGLEWSARYGFDASQAYAALIEGDYGEQLDQFARGRLERWNLKDVPFSATIRVTVPPYPVESTRNASQMAGVGLDPRVLSDPTHYCPCDVRIERGGPVVAGAHGMVVVVAATGSTFAECRSTLLAMAKDLDIPEKQYRIDPIGRAEKAWDALGELGYLSRQKQAA